MNKRLPNLLVYHSYAGLEGWAGILAAVGTAATVASAASSISSAGGGSFGGAPPPKFTPVDIPSTQQLALQTDIQGYNLADADLAKRFPGLVSENNAQINQAYKQLTGPLDPTVQNSFATQSIENSLNTTGGGNSMASIGPSGSASQNQVAAGISNDVLQKQDSDRSYLDSLIAGNPQRSAGLSGGDVTNLAINNTQLQNDYNQAKFQYQTQKAAQSGGGGF